jgi:hypothetical protein
MIKGRSKPAKGAGEVTFDVSTEKCGPDTFVTLKRTGPGHDAVMQPSEARELAAKLVEAAAHAEDGS